MCLTQLRLEITEKADRTGLQAQAEVSLVLQRYFFPGYIIGIASSPRRESPLLYSLAYRSRQNSLTEVSSVACVRRLLKPDIGLNYNGGLNFPNTKLGSL